MQIYGQQMMQYQYVPAYSIGYVVWLFLIGYLTVLLYLTNKYIQIINTTEVLGILFSILHLPSHNVKENDLYNYYMNYH